MSEGLRDKTVLVTGAASGLGLGCARRFARLGARIIVADVNVQAADSVLSELRTLGANAVRFERLDLTDAQSILQFAQQLTQKESALDVLVNNAGIYPPSNLTHSAEGFELTFAIAHIGHFRLTHALMPLLSRAPAARVVTVSSLVQRKAKTDVSRLDFADGYMPILAYQQAKLSNLLFALELERRLSAAGSSVSSYAAHPGVCRTQIGSNRKIATTDNAWQRFCSRALAWGLSHVGQAPENGASPIVAATTADFPRGAFLGPKYLFETFGPPVVVKPGPAAQDASLACALWQRTEEMTGLQWTF